VPPNYEEQDVVVPFISQEAYAEKIKSLYGTQQSAPEVKKNKTKINLEEFDEEINGVNLSKLFSAYGPSSVLEKELIRKNRT
jgi:hypothetical protein